VFKTTSHYHVKPFSLMWDCLYGVALINQKFSCDLVSTFPMRTLRSLTGSFMCSATPRSSSLLYVGSSGWSCIPYFLRVEYYYSVPYTSSIEIKCVSIS